MIGALLLVPMLALGASFRTDTRTVAVQPVEGLRADSLQRAEFLDAFRSTLAQSGFNTQERVRGEWVGRHRVREPVRARVRCGRRRGLVAARHRRAAADRVVHTAGDERPQVARGDESRIRAGAARDGSR
jgi:hypothetical protein